ncbi:hypothetical protein QR680_010384 [Steinernema hermaphroditum]|uniref:Uncharacterized protein n=1 Tax=Steinernema hermaphroditum TaxID=289476 RepID=A0AA39IPZ7_9BILA|nr:hypothetical protein QR680_010384 [Steinernema hermaphroditum]
MAEENKAAQIRKQVEYYFGDLNLTDGVGPSRGQGIGRVFVEGGIKEYNGKELDKMTQNDFWLKQAQEQEQLKEQMFDQLARRILRKHEVVAVSVL